MTMTFSLDRDDWSKHSWSFFCIHVAIQKKKKKETISFFFSFFFIHHVSHARIHIENEPEEKRKQRISQAITSIKVKYALRIEDNNILFLEKERSRKNNNNSSQNWILSKLRNRFFSPNWKMKSAGKQHKNKLFCSFDLSYQ